MRFLLRILSKLGLPFLYKLADYLLYPLVYYVIRYRRHLVRLNLSRSFPNMSAEQIRLLERKFYHQFCSVLVEIVYSYRMSIEEIKEHVRFSGIERLIELNLKYGGSFIMLGHLGCWEWHASIHHHVSAAGIVECSIYRQLKQPSVDRIMREIRERIGGMCCEKSKILKTIILRRKEAVPTIYGMLSDQKPSPANMHYWTEFLHQDTAFLSGTEVLARKYKLPVFYFYITQSQRGYYDIDIRLISEQPELTEEYSITADYVKLLEANIQQQPHLWLWTHNRWKWSRQDLPANVKTNLKP